MIARNQKTRNSHRVIRLKGSKPKTDSAQTPNEKMQLKGGKRVTDSIKIKQNRIIFNYENGNILDRRGLIKSIYSSGPKRKVMGRIDDIQEIKLGMETANFIELQKLINNKKKRPINENLCLSIVFKSQVKTIDLIAPSATVLRKWQKQLQKLIKASDDYKKIKEDFDLFLLDQFQKADKDQSGVITFDEALAMLRNLNIAFDEMEVQKLFEKANYRKLDSLHEDGLDCEEFIEFYNLISYTKTLYDEFACLSKGTEMLNMNQFRKFLVNTQKIEPELADQMSQELLAKYEPLEAHRENVLQNGHIVSCKGFRNMVIAPEFDITQKHREAVPADMSRPLTDYFIATSHNTYVAEDQLEGRSTTETYRIYLSEDCRSVELDITDGEREDDEPVVFHKRTIMTKMSLREIVATIAEYAFRHSPYPVILSLENNCKRLSSQRQAAMIFREGFGEALITRPLFGDHEWRMPSPEDLKGRIIIKGKRLPLTADCNVGELEIKHHLARELSDLVWYCSSRKFAFDDDDFAYNEMSSVEEGKSEKYASKQLQKYRRFTSRHLTKVYPFGLRFFSSNFNPIPHWRAGAQMVALNYQTPGNAMLLNRALFAHSGGYVKKPPHLSSPDASLQSGQVERYRLIIRVLCAFNLPLVDRGIVDPFVQIRLFGGKQFRKKRRKTPVVQNNGLNPQWNKEFCFNIEIANLPLVFVRFQVYDQNRLNRNTLIGQRMLTFDAIAEGYRNVPLHDINDRPIDKAKLVVAIEMKHSSKRGFNESTIDVKSNNVTQQM